MKVNTKKTLHYFLKHSLKYKTLGFFMMLSVTGGSIMNLVAPLYFKRFFDVLTGEITVLSIPNELVSILMSILLIYVIGWVFWRSVTFTSTSFQTRIMTNLTNDCFAYIQKHSTSFFNNNFVGSLVRKVSRFSRSFEGISDLVTFDLATITISIIMIATVLSYRNIYLGIVILVWTVIYIGLNYIFSRYKLKYDIEKSELDSKVTGSLADTITNHLNIKFFTSYNRELQNFSRVTEKLRKLRAFTWNMDNFFEAGQTFLMIVLEIGIFYFAIQLWDKGLITVGDFVLIQTYLVTLFMRLWNVGRIIRRFYEYLADAEEMIVILNTPHEIKDGKYAKKLIIENGKIEIKKMSFSYNKTRRVLSNIAFKVAPGERVALIGPSGSGKSTMVNLLLRNFDVEKGSIKIDDQKISSVTQDSLRSNISVVNQDAILFHRSLRENIKYGKPNATNKEVEQAAKLAHAHEFINKFQDGYSTMVGERGVKLSGGERQRVAIARAILKDAPILVLDEATSSLDSESEHLIQQALESLMKNKTVIVVAHRLSTIMNMDRIIVLENGKIIEIGSHAQLIKKKTGLYKSLWKRQVGGFIT